MTPFERELMDARDALRGYALSLTRCEVRADDLLQDTLLRALDKQHLFTMGTSVKRWSFTIMRNLFLSGFRKEGRMVDDVDGMHSLRLATPAEQEHREDLRDVWRVFETLSENQQHALYLVGVLGYQYEEAAAVLDAAVGTIKSQVHRARANLEKRYEAETCRATPA